MKFKSRFLVLAIAVSAGCLVMAAPASADTLAFNDSRYLGLIVSGEPASEASEAVYINTLLAQASPSAGTVVDGHTYTRSSNDCSGACPAATATGAVTDESKADTGSFGTGYTYLLAKYDGPNGGDVVWYVGGLTGTFDIPSDGTSGGFCTTGACGLSHWALFNPSTTGASDPGPTQGVVPEPASLLLLGSGLAGAAWRARRKKAVV